MKSKVIIYLPLGFMTGGKSDYSFYTIQKFKIQTVKLLFYFTYCGKHFMHLISMNLKISSMRYALLVLKLMHLYDTILQGPVSKASLVSWSVFVWQPFSRQPLLACPFVFVYEWLSIIRNIKDYLVTWWRTESMNGEKPGL